MLANPSLFTNIGDPSAENSRSKTIKNYYSDANFLYLYSDREYNDYKLPVPMDETRRNFALDLADIAIDFIVAHELVHISNGHVDFANMKLNYWEYEERTFLVFSENDILTIQTLEMDADCLAASKMLGNEVRAFLGERSRVSEIEPFCTSFEDVMFNWGLAISTIICLIAESTTYYGVDCSHSHPHPRVRQIMMTSIIDAYLNDHYPHLNESLPRLIFNDNLMTVENSYVEITGNPVDYKVLSQAVNDEKAMSPEFRIQSGFSFKIRSRRHTYSCALNYVFIYSPSFP